MREKYGLKKPASEEEEVATTIGFYLPIRHLWDPRNPKRLVLVLLYKLISNKLSITGEVTGKKSNRGKCTCQQNEEL
jgi:hypothetical protein